MNSIKCYDIVSALSGGVNDEFGSVYRVNKDKDKLMKMYCSMVDSISKEFSGSFLEVEVDKQTMNISISLTCKEMTIEESDHMFYKLVSNASSFSVKKADGIAKIRINFVFPGIWEKSL